MGVFMLTKWLTILSLCLTFNAAAECFGSGNLKTCIDSNNNTYQIQKFGNTTIVNGYNANTGSTWSQSSSKFGNSTYTNGTAANGNSWNSTTTTLGDSRYIHGIDSNGNSFVHLCNQYGCL